tara:strand:- start:45 stop:431 length:387 start_codon:yes stop_codon:yes gene_type:complete
MNWKNILKQDNEREDAEIELERALDEWGKQKDISDFADLAERYNYSLYNSDIMLDASFELVNEDRYDDDPESVMEDDEGYVLINFNNNKGEFAKAEYTYNNGYDLLEYDFKNLSVEEMRQYAKDLDRD